MFSLVLHCLVAEKIEGVGKRIEILEFSLVHSNSGNH